MAPVLLAIAACLPVSGDRILMRDLAAALPAFASGNGEEIVGFAPAPGSRRVYSPAELNRLAARRGIRVAGGPVCFEREMETLTRERAIAALRESLPGGAELELIDFTSGPVPKGALEFPKSGLTPAPAADPRASTVWRGRIRYGAARSVPVSARVRVWIPREAAVAVEDLAAGELISDSQVRFEKVDAPPFGESPAAAVAGLSLRRPIRAGAVIPASAIEAPADISRGDRIELEARYGAAVVRVEARAEGSGRAGDRISVRNLESGKTLRARVLRRGAAEVE